MGTDEGDTWWNERGAPELRDMLLDWDPIGVSAEPGWPRDEYDDLIPPLRERLEAGAHAGELAIFLEAHVSGHMELDVDPDREERFAARLVAWWARHKAH